MITFHGLLPSLPSGIRYFIVAFVAVLSVGFFTGLLFVRETQSTRPAGIEENYLGNEEKADVEVMKFKKSPREMLTTVHSHMLSMSLIFFLLGGLVWLTRLPNKWKLFLTLEPFLSILLTFGGLYLLWSGVLWMKYVVMVSGIFMTLTFSLNVILVLVQGIFPNRFK